MLNKEQNVEVSAQQKLNSSNTAYYIKEIPLQKSSGINFFITITIYKATRNIRVPCGCCQIENAHHAFRFSLSGAMFRNSHSTLE